uniref:DNA polymerase delta subunit 2 n=2 Tax=Rhodosorus marinus TaxID=101924 RepID=A0A7S2ZYN9_9RHOD|mmetsp:Transcript_37689/g.150304  ORF Transcript_37689/g.150304 Transcript_37689/m.150304 type:complete len:353 (+) Transcript_37689:503-1561(+)
MAQVDACVVRKELAYEEKWRRFELGERKYGQQYSQVYFNRLNMMREQLKKAALQRWSSLQEDSIMERMVKAKDGVESVIVGILFKEMKLKPSILQEYAKHGAAMMPNPPRRAEKLYADESDMLILEDETGRIPLEFPEEREILKDLREEFLVSGLVVAVKGAKTKKGLFSVAGVCPVSVLPQPSPSIFEDDAYVCIVSGLCFGDETVNPLYADLLLETLKGAALADATENFKLAHVIVAGNSVCRAKDGSDKGEYLKSHKAIDRKAQDEAAFPVRELDRFLCGVASAIPLELMPGETDPVNYLLPQQAFHPCLIPDSTKFTSVHRSTNPSEFSLGGQLFLGTSGQNVDDYMR